MDNLRFLIMEIMNYNLIYRVYNCIGLDACNGCVNVLLNGIVYSGYAINGGGEYDGGNKYANI